jgi:alkylation response protein AidB-like acyl-CoA dehydrogenase
MGSLAVHRSRKARSREYSVSRAFVDARIQTIYGGTIEIMKTIIAKDLGI